MFRKLGSSYDTSPKTADEAEFIIVDLEHPLPPKEWGSLPTLANSILVATRCFPPIILAEIGMAIDQNIRMILDGLISDADQLPTYRTEDELLDWLHKLEQALPFYNQKDPTSDLDPDTIAKLLGMLVAASRMGAK
jgi:hypothetical protein